MLFSLYMSLNDIPWTHSIHYLEKCCSSLLPLLLRWRNGGPVRKGPYWILSLTGCRDWIKTQPLVFYWIHLLFFTKSFSFLSMYVLSLFVLFWSFYSFLLPLLLSSHPRLSGSEQSYGHWWLCTRSWVDLLLVPKAELSLSICQWSRTTDLLITFYMTKGADIFLLKTSLMCAVNCTVEWTVYWRIIATLPN